VLVQEKLEMATAILRKKELPNTLLVDDSVSDDHYTIAVAPVKLNELNLFNGDSVLVKGKKRKNTVAIVVADDSLPASKMRMSKVIRSNLR
jgi:transitional endoplasmic reticulum ATPase